MKDGTHEEQIEAQEAIWGEEVAPGRTSGCKASIFPSGLLGFGSRTQKMAVPLWESLREAED